MRTLILSLCFIMVACGKTPARQKGGADLESFSEADSKYLMDVNSAQVDLQDAVRLAFGKTAVGLQASEKANKIADILRQKVDESKCEVIAWESPTWDYQSDWVARQAIGRGSVGGCPLTINRQWSYVKGSHYLAVLEGFSYGPELRGFGSLASRSGAYNVHLVTTKGGKPSLQGQGEFKYKLVDGSFLTVQLMVTHDLSGAGSFVTAVLTRSNDRQYIARVVQTGGPQSRRYTLGTQLIDSKQFQDLFSMLGLDEIMDKTRNLR